MTEVTVAPPQQPDREMAKELPPLWTPVVLGIACAFAALELAVSARYGIHRDELYFLACARHLAWGFVDQPPLVPAVAWLAMHVASGSVVALRTLPAIAGGAAVVLAGLMARELGGGRKAQALAAVAAATSPQLLAAFHLLSTAAFDTFFWSAMCYLTLRLLRTGEARWWLAIGLVAGVALENKLNIGFLVLGLVIGFLLGGRGRVLLSPWLWAGAGIALVIWLPNIIWNAQHDWAAISMLRSLHQENSGLGPSLAFIPSQVVVAGPLLVVFWVTGLRRLLASSFARPLGVAFLSLLVLFTLIGGKSYYLAGLYYVLFAAGGVWVESRLASRRPARGMRGWLAFMLVGGLSALPLSLPVLPESALARGAWEGKINKDLSATVGWQDFVRQIAGIAGRLPAGQRAHVVLFTGDYGAAGAIDLYGGRYGLPHAISGHNNYWWWGHSPAADGATTIAVNLPRSYLVTIFRHVVLAGAVRTPHDVWTEERGDPIWICTGQKVGWAAAWPAARHYG